MAHLLGAETVSLEFPTKTVFDSVTVGLNEGDRIGVVGRNGDGKSTLLKLLAKTLQPDFGRVTYRGSLKVGMLTQVDSFAGVTTIGEAVVGQRPEHEWAGDPKVRDVLAGLLGDLDWSKTIDELSGGQRRRVALAALLVQDWDVVMLDEPTNHLDVEGVAWLADHLNRRWPANQGGLLVVTHDRWFLDEVCNYTWEVHDGIIEPFEGGYAAYILQRVERDRSAAASESRRQNLLRKELAWLRRGAPARTTKPKFRMDAAAELISNEPNPRDSVALSKLATTRLGKDVLDAEDISYEVAGRTLLHDVTWRLGPGDRFGLVGVNGAGKTTLLKLLTGELTPSAGRVKRGKTVQVAVLTQDVQELDEFADERIYELIAREKSYFVVDKQEVSTSSLVEQLGFTKAQLQTPIKELSGGQRRRLQFLRLLFGEPNVLILDEPTNDLDTDILTAMEHMLDSWPGTLIVVSHDRYLLERVTDQQYALLGDGSLRHLTGGIEQYLKLRAASLGTKVETKASAPVSTGLKGAALRDAEKNLARIERALQKLSTDEAEVHAKMGEHSQEDFEGLAKLVKLQNDLNQKREDLEAEWLETSEALA
jgi:ATPase subunit of ABC transporter with duplicated ATPase domains